MIEPTVELWADQLTRLLREMKQVVVAFSGGVDSSVVAKGAHLALGERALAVTGSSHSLSSQEREAAIEVATQIGIRHEILQTEEFSNPSYLRNDGIRCYHCKAELYSTIHANSHRWPGSVIVSGANVDDAGDYRPGLRAAAEQGVRHPLQEIGATKEIVRELARWWNLPNAGKPASPCLSSRVAIGLEVTPERLKRIEEAERLLHQLGCAQVRVRHHPGDHARIEVEPADIGRLCEPALRGQVVSRLTELGFKFISLDLEGFRSGALNALVPVELIRLAERK